MKKKLFISTHTLNIGGVERSFIGLLENLDYSKFDVDVFVYQHHGELFHLLPKEINLLPENRNYALLLEPIQHSLKEGNWRVFMAKLCTKIYTGWRERFLSKDPEKNDSLAHVYLYKIANKLIPEISEKHYDTVLAFLHPNYFERSKVKAEQYIAWIHTDYSFLNIDREEELKMWKRYDVIAGISQDNAKAFCEVFPEIKSKVTVLENVLSEQFVKQQADVLDVSIEMPKVNDELIFLSIGRFTYQKNFENIPYISKLLKKRGLKFKWYIIGYGSEEDKAYEAIEKTNMRDCVVILGKRTNPYPYILKCDFYIQPSRFEGKAVTVREAQMLGKPAIITNFSSAESQLKNGYDGIIVPLENQNCAEGIFNFVQDENLVLKIVENISIEDYSNVDQIQKLYHLMYV